MRRMNIRPTSMKTTAKRSAKKMSRINARRGYRKRAKFDEWVFVVIMVGLMIYFMVVK